MRSMPRNVAATQWRLAFRSLHAKSVGDAIADELARLGKTVAQPAAHAAASAAATLPDHQIVNTQFALEAGRQAAWWIRRCS